MKGYLIKAMLPLILAPIFIAAQTGMPLSISIYDESNQLPKLNLIGAGIEPGFEIGTHFEWVQRSNHFVGLQINIGAFGHKHVSKSRYLEIELMLRKKFGRIFLQPGGGVMLNLHQFPNNTYQINDGSPQVIVRRRINPIPTLHLQAGYNIGTVQKPINLFIKYELGVELGFVEAIPLLPHTFLHIGVETSLFNGKK